MAQNSVKSGCLYRFCESFIIRLPIYCDRLGQSEIQKSIAKKPVELEKHLPRHMKDNTFLY